MSLRDRIRSGRVRRFLKKVPKDKALRVVGELLVALADDGKIDAGEWESLRDGLREILADVEAAEEEV